MSTQPAALERQPKLPRKLKKQQARQAVKANPGGSSSQPYRSRTSSAPRSTSRTQAKSVRQSTAPRPPKRNVRSIDERALANLARKLESGLAYRDAYAIAKNRQYDQRKLAELIAEGPFRVELAKYPGNEPCQLMERVINHLRTERPKRKPVAEAPKSEPSSKPKHTEAQKAQQARDRQAPPRPAAHTTSSYTHPKGAVKRNIHRKTYSDERIVRDALAALLQGNPELKTMFCRASNDRAIRKLLYTNAHTKRLAKALREEVAERSRVYTHLETAARKLIAKYKRELEAAEHLAAQEAAARHEERKLTATQAAATRVKARNKKANMGVIPRNLRNEMAWAS